MFPYDNDYANGNYASQLAWLLFVETGEPGYYMMYSDLSGERKKEEDERFR